ncbi:disintegrin and metalloproteinase domain-containing protein 21-like [Rhynchonycteris naso]
MVVPKQDMRLAEGSVPLWAAFLLPVLWVVWSPVQGSQGRLSWRYISSEVVIPQKQVHHGKGGQVPGWLSYSLRFGGQRHVIRLRRKKLFLSRDVLLMTQDDQGALQMEYPFVPLDCYYIGFLEGVPLSMVTMDTCYGGLEGIMKMDDLAYEIKPLKDSRTFEHVVSQIVADTKAIGPMYSLGYKEEKHPLFSPANASAAPRISSKRYSSHKGNIKGCVMSSRSMYTVFSNVSQCAQYLIRIVSIVDSMLQGLDMRYYVSVMIIYNTADPTPMDNYRVPGSPFYDYYSRHIHRSFNPYSAVIVIKDGPEDIQFRPHVYGMCGDRGLIMVGQLGRHYLLISIIATQHIARSYGLYYDKEYCVCQRRTTCIMSRFPVLTDAFSNCSFAYAQNALLKYGSCVFETNVIYYNKSLTHAWCGNSVVDEDEHCDCGSFKQCYHNQCCNADCRFTPGSACNTGRCCTNCTYSPRGTLCRPVQNICDLPEYCLGSHFLCPDDFYLQDGTPCTEEGYCYHGNCTDRNLHCKEVFGEGAQNAPDTCYVINRKGHRFGHCEIGTTHKPIACAPEDIQCGRLQCTNVTHLPKLQEHVGFHQSVFEGSLCFGVGSHRGTGTTDVGVVRPGTPCGGRKFCLNNLCSGTVAAMNYNCPPNKCNRRGVCNNKGHCHCRIGWDPPQCILRGAGGSVDSGPPPRRMRTVTQSDLSVLYLRVVFGRIYAFIASLLIAVGMNVGTVSPIRGREVSVED